MTKHDGRRNNGGARPKAREDDVNRGRPRLDGEDETVRVTVTLPRAVAEQLRRVGDGNMSLGVRRLIESMVTNALD